MARHRRALSLALLAACTPKAAPNAETPAPAVSVTVAASSAAPMPPAPPAPPSKCRAVGPGQISDDDHPAVSGLGEMVELGEWMEARGSTREAAYALYARRSGMSVDDASISLNPACYPAKVGDPVEEALVCRTTSRMLLTADTLFGFVVRNKKPVFVLEAPLSLVALDWPDQRQLDLAFVLHGPTKYEVLERAPDGAMLVEAPSVCREAESAGRSWAIENADGIETHDCAGAKKLLAGMNAGSPPDPGTKGSLAAARAFVTKACTRDLGFWTWSRGQFVRDAAAKR